MNMKSERNSFEPFLSIVKIVYMCGVLLYFMFLTRNALGQTVSSVTTTHLGKTVSSSQPDRGEGETAERWSGGGEVPGVCEVGERESVVCGVCVLGVRGSTGL